MPGKEIFVAFILFVTFQSSLAQRRIKDGQEVEKDKPYVVYLLLAEVSPVKYNGWTCGGAIVTQWFIVTSAACVEDAKNMYAIAGYKKFVSANKINEDNCTKEKKKKIVMTCVPKSYEFDYHKPEIWSNIDIAAVKVESPYDFSDQSFAKLCSYIPAKINISYSEDHIRPYTNAIVMGWGHNKIWRNTNDSKSYNVDNLSYAATRIVDKAECKKYYTDIHAIIDKYMICTFENGNIDSKGDEILRAQPTAMGCTSQLEKLMGVEGPLCETVIEVEEGDPNFWIDRRREGTRRNGKRIDNMSRYKVIRKQADSNETEQTTTEENETETVTTKEDLTESVPTEENQTDTEPTEENQTDTVPTEDNQTEEPTPDFPGLCQNDHGGPLVTWVGKEEQLIGVATLFRTDDNSNCQGPYLFTSTKCNGAFLGCVLDEKNSGRRNMECGQDPSESGFELVQRRISWIDHPDGPAENEKPRSRPQISIQDFHGLEYK